MSEEVHQRITGHTELLGLIAYPIRPSKSPRLHNLALSKLGLDYAYLCFEVNEDELPGAVDAFKALKVRGWNVSMPNKMPIIELLDEVSDAVRMIGACNTVINDNSHLRGEVTDGIGYVAALKDHCIDVAGKTITLMGAGGAATAIAVQSALDGDKAIRILNKKDRFYKIGERTVETIKQNTSCDVSIQDLDDLDAFRASVASSDILANGTNVGMGKPEGISALPDTSVPRPDLFVSDVVYAPEKSHFLEQAKAAGCQYMNGLDMMYDQGAASFKMWTGQDMPLDYVREHMADES